MKTIAAILVAGAAALSITSCTCPACQGSGLQVRTSTGLVPYVTGSVAHKNVATVPCQPCQGTGIQAFGAMKAAGEFGQGVYQQVDDNNDRRDWRKKHRR